MPTNKPTHKKTIAVFFGGRSPEHDVSVVSGLQVLSAIDGSHYDAFPVYITTDGEWLVGDALRERAHYMISDETRKKLDAVNLQVSRDVGRARKGVLVSQKSGLLGGAKTYEFDVAMPCFHGLYGEDGQIQGLFEMADIPYTGMRTMASSLLMDKGASKAIMKSRDIPVLPYVILKRPEQGYLIDREQLEDMLGDLSFPCIIKPSHLGSSIGVAKVETVDDINAVLPTIFEYDDAAIVEPFVEHLIEYNVAVSKAFADDFGGVQISAVERPKGTDELLDFKQKYLSGGDNKTGTKTPGAISQGMLSLTRELNPNLGDDMQGKIKSWAIHLFNAIDGTGAPRIDFIGNSKTGEIWMNEVNPCPGSFGYFLWEALPDPVLFSDFLSGLIEEAVKENQKRRMPRDPVPADARLFKR
jgi:D-alanine-D-alanine ligase